MRDAIDTLARVLEMQVEQLHGLIDVVREEQAALLRMDLAATEAVRTRKARGARALRQLEATRQMVLKSLAVAGVTRPEMLTLAELGRQWPEGSQRLMALDEELRRASATLVALGHRNRRLIEQSIRTFGDLAFAVMGAGHDRMRPWNRDGRIFAEPAGTPVQVGCRRSLEISPAFESPTPSRAPEDWRP